VRELRSAVVCLALVLSAFAGIAPASAECPAVQPRNPDGNYIVPGVLGGIPYRKVDGLELSLDAYVQRKGDRRPAVVVVHGGGWTSGSRATYVGQILELLTRAGYNWFSVDYRLGGVERYTAALDDLKAAIEFVRCNAAAFRIDPDRIALVGEDAGAHLAALAAAEKPAGVQAAVLLGGFYDLRALERFSSLDRALVTRASPVGRVSAGMPDLLAVHGTADRDVPPDQAMTFCEQVRRAGGRCEYLPVEGAIHAAENWRPEQWTYKQRVVDWLGGRLGLHLAGHEPYRGALQKDVVFGKYAHRTRAYAELLLDAWAPEGPGPFPAVIAVHGGGWEAGDKVTYITPALEALARGGFAWFSIDYRLTPYYRHTNQLDDLRRAIRFVRYNARRFKIDPKRIALLGESASGQMVTQVASEPCRGKTGVRDAVERQPCTVAAAVSFYGVYDFTTQTDASPRSIPARLFGVEVLDEAGRGLLRRYSPLYNVHKGMPPVLLIHGTAERLYSQGVAMDAKLAAVGVPHELYKVQGAPHGMENWEGHPEWTGYKEKLVAWLRRQLETR
jgi:acetyl esterase